MPKKQKNPQFVKKFLDGNTVNVQGQQTSTSSTQGGAANFGVSKMSAPSAVSARRVGRPGKLAGQKTDRLQGTQELATIATVGAKHRGDILYRADIRLDVISNNRLALYSRLYSKWRIDKWTINYKPSCPSTTQGQLVTFIEPDPDVNYVDSNPNNAQNGTEHVNNCVNNVWEAGMVPYRQASVDRAQLYTNSLGLEPRTDCGGQMLCVAMTDLGNDLTFGTLTLDYEITFSEPNSQISAMTAPAAASIFAGGTISVAKPLGTTPVTRWNTIGVDAKAGDNVKFPNSNVGDRVAVLLSLDGTGSPTITPTYRNLTADSFDVVQTSTAAYFYMELTVNNNDGDGLAPRLTFGTTGTTVTDAALNAWAIPSASSSLANLRGRKLQAEVFRLGSQNELLQRKLESMETHMSCVQQLCQKFNIVPAPQTPGQ